MSYPVQQINGKAAAEHMQAEVFVECYPLTNLPDLLLDNRFMQMIVGYDSSVFIPGKVRGQKMYCYSEERDFGVIVSSA